jgi:hypothetical protein
MTLCSESRKGFFSYREILDELGKITIDRSEKDMKT